MTGDGELPQWWKECTREQLQAMVEHIEADELLRLHAEIKATEREIAAQVQNPNDPRGNQWWRNAQYALRLTKGKREIIGAAITAKQKAGAATHDERRRKRVERFREVRKVIEAGDTRLGLLALLDVLEN